jgi:hypothetical protein
MPEPANPHPPPPQFQINVDGQHFTVHSASMTGAQIKALVGKDAQYQLFEEISGNAEDKLIGDGDSVAIRNGLHFYTVAAASFGVSRGPRWA